MERISWGVLSTAKIGLRKVIPALQKGNYSEVTAIASRDFEKAQQATKKLGIPKAYGSYEELLADDEIEAVYIPLPNHLHIEWTIKSLEAGKHVLCEKPIGQNFKEAEHLQNEMRKYPGLKVMEAFMYRHHPRILKIKELVKNKRIGELRSIQSMFTYYNDDPGNIRNQVEIGGGGLLDIGCYSISLSRFLFANEPNYVCASIEFDPKFKVDRLVSAILEFEKGTSIFTCSTQIEYHQYARILGTHGRIEIENPFNPPSEKPSKLMLYSGSDSEEILFKACDQYVIQGDLFSQAILNDIEVPTPLQDGIANMKVIDKIFESSEKGAWIRV
jgi:predicted dehydrogenase